MTTDTLTIERIEEARARIRSSIFESPCAHSASLSRATGCSIFLKLENLQMTGSFKERGACNKLMLLSAEERARGVITASAGNHGQAVAFHARHLGGHATVVMPETTPLIKVQAAQGFGAHVILHGSNYDEAAEFARALQADRGLVYVHPFDDFDIMAGQGTIGLELVEQVPDLDAVIVPIGGGGLLAGIAVALRARAPKARVYGVETLALPSMKAGIASGGPVTLPSGKTLADGIAVKRAGSLTLPIVRDHVSDIALVDDEEIAEAILVLLEQEKTVVEGAGVVGLAALLSKRFSLANKRVVVVLSGGNIDVNLISRIIERGLVKSGRMLKVRMVLPDVAGALAEVARVVGALRANIMEIRHDRAFAGVQLGETLVDLVLETRGFAHAQEIQQALEQLNYRLS